MENITAKYQTESGNSSDESCDESEPGDEATVAPYSSFLHYDKYLEISNRKFKTRLTSDLKKQVTKPKSEFLIFENLVFPNTYEMAQFISKTNIELEPNESRKDYEKRLELQTNWKLLTSATSSINGYFGSAYWNANRRQIIIVHRCAIENEDNHEELPDLENILTHYLTQIESACTFSYEVQNVLEELKKEGQIGLQLFFTGHSLGGVLAQVTTFAAKYLTNITGHSDVFMKRRCNDGEGFHAHTIVFDSPGCADILEKLADQLDVRYEDKTIRLNELDISNYMLLPNMVNCCEKQIGNCFLILPSDTKGVSLSQHYHQPYDSLDIIINFMVNGRTNVYEVIDWPINDVRPIGDECETLFEPMLKWIENYQPDTKSKAFVHVQKQCQGYYPIRYQIKKYNGVKCKANVFTESELQFLRHFQWLKGVPEYFKPQSLFNTDDNDAANILKLLKHLEIKNSVIKRVPEGTLNLEQLIPFVKRLTEIYPDLLEKTNSALKAVEVRKFAYKNESIEYVKKLDKITALFKRKTTLCKEIHKFLDHEDIRVCQIATKNDSDIVAARIYNILTTRDEILSKFTLRWQNVLAINKSISLKKMLSSEELPKTLLTIDFNASEINEDSEELFLKLLKQVKNNSNIKLILINNKGASNKYIQSKLKDYQKIINYNGLKWSDLVREERNQLLTKPLVSFQGSEELVKLNAILPYRVNDIVDSDYLNNILDEETIISLIKNRVLTIGQQIVDLGEIAKYYVPRMLQLDFKVHDGILKDRNESDLIAISGVDIFDLEHKYGLGGEDIIMFESDTEDVERVTVLREVNAEASFQKLIRKPCLDNRNIHWIENISNQLYWRRTRGSFEFVQKYLNTDDTITNLLPTLCRVSRGMSSLLDEAHIASKINEVKEFIISDKAGMGKSTVITYIAKVIKNAYPNIWMVRINLNDCTQVLKEELVKRNNGKHENFDAVNFLLNQMLESNPITKFQTSFQRNLFKECLLKLGGVVLMFDGFDEICPNYDHIFIEIITMLKSTMVRNIFVTTRPQTKDQIENALHTPSLKMRPFFRRDKERFLMDFWSNNCSSNFEKDLKMKAKLLIKAFSISVKDKHTEFSGIPLQCRMLAEVYDSYTVETLPEKISLVELYEAFVNKKLKVYELEKCPDIKGNINAEDSENLARSLIREYHRYLALKLLGIDKCSVFEHQSFYADIKEILAKKSLKVGLVLRTGDNPLFVHKTFAEYFAADYFTTAFTKPPISDNVAYTLMNEIMLHDFDFWVVRSFINDRLINWSKYDVAVQAFGDYLVKSWESNRQSWSNNVGNTALHIAAKTELNQLLKFFLDCSLKDEDTAKKLVSFVSARNKTSTALTGKDLARKLETYHFEYLLTKIKKMSADIQRQYLLANIFSIDCDQTIIDLIENDPELGNMSIEIRSNYHLIDKYHNAASKGNTQDLKLTLQEVDIDTRHYLNLSCLNHGHSALCLAIRNGHSETANFITEQLSPESLQLLLNKPYNSILLAAVESGQIEMVKLVVEKFKNNYMLRDRTSAIEIILTKRTNMLSYLLDNGFDINLTAGGDRLTLLHYAVQINFVATVEILLQHGLNVDVTDSRNRTPLHIAVCNRYPTVALKLLQRNANANAKDCKGNTPLHEVALSKTATPRMVLLLVEHGGKLDCLNIDNETPLDLAMYNENTAGLLAFVPLQPYITSTSLKTRKWLWKDSLPQRLTKIEMDFLNIELNPSLTEESIEKEVTRGELMIKAEDLDLLLFTHDIYVDYFVADYFVNELQNVLAKEDNLENFINVFFKERLKEARSFLIQTLIERHEFKYQILRDIIRLICEYWFRTPQSVFKRNKDSIWKKMDSFQQEEMIGLILECLTRESSNELVTPCVSALELEINLTINTAIEKENECLLDIFFKFLNTCSDNTRKLIISSILSGEKVKECVEYLLDKIKNYPSLKDIFKELFQKQIQATKFLEASETGSIDVLKIMLREAKDPEARNNLFVTLRETTDFNKELLWYRCYYRPFNLAVKNDHYQTVQFLIENEIPVNSPVVLDKRDVFETSDCVVPPLFNAIKLGNLEMAKLLLENGADINAKVGNWCVLKMAVKYKFVEFCQLSLLSWKYKDTRVDKTGALHVSLEEGYTDIALLLLNSGADVNEKDTLGRCPLSLAVSKSEVSESMIISLLEKGANVNEAGKDGRTPMHFAVLNQSTVKIVLILLEKGANVNAADDKVETPLFLAAKYGTVEMVQTIVANEALANARNIIDETPLHLAAIEGREDIVKVLLEAGANPEIRNRYNETPLDMAETFGHAKVVDILLKYEKTTD